MNEVHCNVVRDLLPLYVDDVLSVESCELVERHAEGCAPCTTQLGKLKAKIPEASATTEIGAKEAMRALKKSFQYRLIKGIALAIAAMLLLVFLGGTVNNKLFEECNTAVGGSQISEYSLSCLKTGEMMLAYSVPSAGRIGGWISSYEAVSSGTEIYMTPLRPLFIRPFRKYAFEDSQEEFFRLDYITNEGSVYIVPDMDEYAVPAEAKPIEISKIYLGTKEDPLLIWQKGDQVPLVPQHIQDRYDQEQQSQGSGAGEAGFFG